MRIGWCVSIHFSHSFDAAKKDAKWWCWEQWGLEEYEQGTSSWRKEAYKFSVRLSESNKTHNPS